MTQGDKAIRIPVTWIGATEIRNHASLAIRRAGSGVRVSHENFVGFAGFKIMMFNLEEVFDSVQVIFNFARPSARLRFCHFNLSVRRLFARMK